MFQHIYTATHAALVVQAWSDMTADTAIDMQAILVPVPQMFRAKH